VSEHAHAVNASVNGLSGLPALAAPHGVVMTAGRRWMTAVLVGGAVWNVSIRVTLAAKFTRGEFVG